MHACTPVFSVCEMVFIMGGARHFSLFLCHLTPLDFYVLVAWRSDREAAALRAAHAHDLDGVVAAAEADQAAIIAQGE